MGVSYRFLWENIVHVTEFSSLAMESRWTQAGRALADNELTKANHRSRWFRPSHGLCEQAVAFQRPLCRIRVARYSMPAELEVDSEVSVLGRATIMNPANKVVTSALVVVVFIPFLALGVVGNAAGIDSALGLLAVILGPVLSVGVAWQVLRWQGSGWREIGLAKPKSWPRTALLALAALFGAVVIITLVQIVGENLPGAEPIDQSRFDSLVGSVPFLITSLLGAWTTIAFGEEMLFRAFFISRVAAVLENQRFGSTFAVAAGAVVFGVTHFLEGPVGIVSNGSFGLLFGVIYIRTRNLWITIIAHGILNTVRFILVFAGATG